MDLSMWVTEKNSGKPLDGNYDITYQLFDQERNGNIIWEETQNYDIHSGVVTTILGKDNPFPEDLDHQTTDYYLGIIVDGDPMDSRKRLSPSLLSVNSLFSENSATLQGKTIGEEEDNIPLLGSGGKLANSLLNTGEDDDQLVLGDDERLHLQNQDTGTTSQTFNLGSNLSLSNRNFDLTVSSNNNQPTLRFNANLNTWQLSTDGNTFGEIVIGSSLNQSIDDIEAQLANKSDINHVHDSGDLPLDNLTGDLLPTITNTYSLGSTTKRWLNTYTQNLYSDNIQATSLTINGSATLGTSGENITFNSSLIPSTSGLNLGSSTNHWSNLYVDNLTVNTTDTNGTTSQYFTINTDAPDNEDSGLRFYRGPTLNTYASFLWDESEQELNFYQHESNQTLGKLNLGGLSVNTDSLFVDSSGNLGIGTTTPVTKLDVSGAVSVYDGYYRYNFGSNGPAGPNGKSLSIYQGSSKAYYNINGQSHIFQGSGVDRVAILNGGNVGIGTTSPGAKLDIYQDSPTASQVLFNIGTSDMANRFTVDEDGDVRADGTIFTTEVWNATVLSLRGDRSTVFRAKDALTSGDKFTFQPYAGPGSLSDADGRQAYIKIDAAINQSSTAAYDGIYLDVTETSTGDGSTGDGNNLLNLAVGGTSKFVVDNTGNVGIGTTSPGARLDIKGGGADILNLQDSSGAEKVTVLESGNLGIGTTEPGYKLEVRGSTIGSGALIAGNLDMTSTQSGGGVYPRLRIGSDQTSVGSERLEFWQGGQASYINNANGNGGISLQLAGSSKLQIQGDGDVIINDGNIGIGTTTPVAKLNVESGTDVEVARFTDETGNNIVIDKDGNLGIGTTSPVAKLNVESGSDVEVARFSDENGNDVVIDKDGNLGIGTTSPGAKLDVNGNVGINGLTVAPLKNLHIVTANTGGIMMTHSADGNIRTSIEPYFIGNRPDLTNLKFKVSDGSNTGQTTVMTLQGNGNIGIGTTEPNYKLEVSGAIMLEDMTAPSSSSGHSGIYSNGGELFTLDALGNANQISPHDENNNWFFNSENINTGETLRVEMEKLTKELDQLLGGGYVFENGELYTQNQENLFNKIENQFDSWIPAFAGMTEEITGMTEELSELTLTVEGLNETDTMIIERLSDHENEIALLKADLLNVKTQIDPNYSNEIQMSNDLISSYSSLEDLGNLLASNEDEEGNQIFTLSADLELVNLKANRIETDALKTNNLELGLDVSGKGVIESGEIETTIETKEVFTDSKIYITPAGNTFGEVLYYDEVVEGESFKVKIEKEIGESINFNWLIIE
jgi:hypothetical protein